MNQDTIKGKWLEVKGEIQKKWGELTGDDLDRTKGDAKSIAGLLQQKYGIAKEEAETKLSDIYSRFEEKKSEVVDAASRKAEAVKGDLRQNLR